MEEEDDALSCTMCGSDFENEEIEMTQSRSVKAPTGTKLSCKGWQQEAAYRMIQNNLDPCNAENPDELIVYGGTGSTANTEVYDGSSWTEVANLASGRHSIQGNVQATNSESAVAGGGEGPGGIVGTTEEWTSPIYSIKTVTVS